ncbi:hypothetical protein ACQEU3_46820 [Spirillospora sp. CA-253888]
MAEVTVPQALPLVTVPGVELMHTGTWPISTGVATFTSADLHNAVAAQDCPAVHRPVLKLGHQEPNPDSETRLRWDGEPAIGYIANPGVVEGGRTLVGDYTGMPGWMTPEVLASAYPQRSIEAEYDHVCQLGHVHPFVITAVALLGTTPPGIGTLQSLQDVAALYGVAASAPEPAATALLGAAGTPVTITVHAAREAPVPNPHPAEVRAGVTTEDVRRAFYGSDYGRSWDVWITEMQLGPEIQIIAVDDATGTLSRVPVQISDGDGEDAVSFGEPIKVVVRYEDAPTGVAAVAAASARPAAVRYASRRESRPDAPPHADNTGALPSGVSVAHNASGQSEPVLTADQWRQVAEQTPVVPPSTGQPAEAATQNPPAAPADGSITTQEGEPVDQALLRQALGLSPEASDDDVRNKLAEHGMTGLDLANAEVVDETGDDDTDTGDGTDTEADDTNNPDSQSEVEAPAGQTPQAAALPPGIVTIDEATLADLRAKAEQGVAARAQQRREERDRVLNDAVRAGKFPPARRAHWETYWERDEDGAKQALASLAPGLVPVADIGEPGSERDLPTGADDDYDRLFSKGA